MLLTLELVSDALLIKSEDVPAWLALLDRATGVRQSGYGAERKSYAAPVKFTIEAVEQPLDILPAVVVGTTSAT